MTAQIPDTILMADDSYDLIGLSAFGLFDPKEFGFEPTMISTACWHGYFMKFELTKEALLLRDLTIRDKNGNYPPINGVEPSPAAHDFAPASYKDLNLLIPYTGSLRLARDFIQEYYVHMGYQKASAYRTVIDAVVDQGKVVSIKDRSQDAAEIRGAFKERYEKAPEKGGLFQSIEEAFSLDMENDLD